MKIRYLKLKSWLLVTLGGLLGVNLAGCEKIFNTACEYGCPVGTFHVRGTVTNSKGEPIEGIAVVNAYEGTGPGGYVMSEVGLDTTGSDGRYEISINGVPDWPSPVGFKDIDNEHNGLYNDTVIPITAPSEAFHGGDGDWDYGSANIELNVTLTEKTNK